MKFNQLYASFPKILETLASPFSGHKRKREQADVVDDRVSVRPAKQAQIAAQPSSSRARAPSHQSNTRATAAPAQIQTSLPQLADQLREATSQSAQAAYSVAKEEPGKGVRLQPSRLSDYPYNHLIQQPAQVPVQSDLLHPLHCKSRGYKATAE